MASYLNLEEAAARLGIPTERLVEMRSQGEVRGFRDGSSWKFPEPEIQRLGEELSQDSGQDSGFGSGILFDSVGSTGNPPSPLASDSGSDLGIGDEQSGGLSGGGSDVNLVASESGTGSDVALVSSSSDIDMSDKAADDLMLELEAPDLELKEPALSHDSEELELASEPAAGAGSSKVSLDNAADASGLSVGDDDQDSDDMVIGGDDQGDDLLSILDSGTDANAAASGIHGSDLDLNLELEGPQSDSQSGNVLSELNLLGEDQAGSGLITGDSVEDNLLGGSGIGSDLELGLESEIDAKAGSSLSGSGLAADDDDDLVIADGDDDLVLSSGGSDISIAGDSGINLMSPSDSGLSLESEPLDLAGSSISAIDLGSSVGEGSSQSGLGSAVDFQADEEFQLSPSGIGIDEDSDSQVIEVEDSAAIAAPVDFGDATFGEEAVVEAEDMFASDAGAFAEGGAMVAEDADAGDGLGIDPRAEPASADAAVPASAGFDITFNRWEVIGLLLILCFFSLSGMLMTDLVRNMWAYSETSAPVSALTDSLIQIMGLKP